MKNTIASGFVLGLGLGITIAWLLEATLIGRGVVSTYLAPLAIASPFVASALRKRAAP